MRSVVLVMLLAIGVAGCDLGDGNGDESAVDKAQFVTEVAQPFQEDLVPLGRVGLSREGGSKTRIAIELDDPPEPILRAGIRRGSCGSTIGAGVVYPLEDVEDGESETVLDVPLRELRLGGYIVIIHPLAQTTVGGTCGDLTSAEEQ
jgi:hypothetical protein